MLNFLRWMAACAALCLAFPSQAQPAQPESAAQPTLPAVSDGGNGEPLGSVGQAERADAGEPVPDDRPGWAEPAPTESLLGALLRLLLVLGVVLAAIYLTLNFGLRRLMRLGPQQQSLLRIHERIPLDAKKSVCVVEVGGEFLLLGVGESDVRLISALDAEKLRAAVERKQQAAPRPLVGKPFWERLLHKPPSKPGGSGPA